MSLKKYIYKKKRMDILITIFEIYNSVNKENV